MYLSYLTSDAANRGQHLKTFSQSCTVKPHGRGERDCPQVKTGRHPQRRQHSKNPRRQSSGRLLHAAHQAHELSREMLTGNDTKRQRKERNRTDSLWRHCGQATSRPTAGSTGARGPGCTPPRGLYPVHEVEVPAGRQRSHTAIQTTPAHGGQLGLRLTQQKGATGATQANTAEPAGGRAPAPSTGRPSPRSPRSRPAARWMCCNTHLMLLESWGSGRRGHRAGMERRPAHEASPRGRC